jgi:hypothetical protein
MFGTQRPGAAVTALLGVHASDYRWAAAAVGSNTAASYQLTTGAPVMAVGGYNGTDPAPTLAEFQADVAAHRVHWFIAGGQRQPRGGAESSGSHEAADIAAWVAATFTPQQIDGVTLYNLAPSDT